MILILGAIILGGFVFGSILVGGIMLWDGKWTLPNTAAREAQKLRVEKAQMEWKLEKAKMQENLSKQLAWNDKQEYQFLKDALNRGNELPPGDIIDG